ncbi:uncharacterized protein LOC127242536 isoform X2 [Andrographis paniculata]|uniref:uncharacterized protein LOC127242536 isoform X2 n=1 Tax=Andrographis paniculata TaxID=175694 RepID=UPI0021E8CE03|nr:uncharacterized protein LOC127242536 isoform X2 [Andrographis paniculata]
MLSFLFAGHSNDEDSSVSFFFWDGDDVFFTSLSSSSPGSGALPMVFFWLVFRGLGFQVLKSSLAPWSAFSGGLRFGSRSSFLLVDGSLVLILIFLLDLDVDKQISLLSSACVLFLSADSEGSAAAAVEESPVGPDFMGRRRGVFLGFGGSEMAPLGDQGKRTSAMRDIQPRRRTINPRETQSSSLSTPLSGKCEPDEICSSLRPALQKDPKLADDSDEEVKTWNLRPRKLIAKKRVLSITVPLSQKEIKEDIISMTGGMRPPGRPKKRPKHLQNHIDIISPGGCLDDISDDTYKI